MASGQTETLFGNARTTPVGGFGGPFYTFTEAFGELANGAGGGGAAIFGDFFFGGFGVGVDVDRIVIPNEPFTVDGDIGMGGLWLGYVPQAGRLVHPYSSLKIGWGSVDMNVSNSDVELADDSFFALMPEVGIELNVFRFCKVAVTAGYRGLFGVGDLPGGFDGSDLSSVSGNILLRFGGFPN